MQMLAKKPEQRPPSAEAVLECLQQIEGGATFPVAIPAGLSDRVKSKWSVWLAGLSQRQRMAALAILLVVFAGIGISIVGRLSGRPTHRAGLPTSPSERHRAFLKSLEPVASANWPLPPTPDGKSMPNPFRIISVNGTVSPNGIGMHPSFAGPASVSYSLGKRYRTFETKVGLNDSSPGSDSPMTFYVYGDGNLLWKSKPVEAPQDLQECKISVQGVNALKLEVNAFGKARGAHGAWLEPALTE